jgi:hypothetical protein
MTQQKQRGTPKSAGSHCKGHLKDSKAFAAGFPCLKAPLLWLEISFSRQHWRHADGRQMCIPMWATTSVSLSFSPSCRFTHTTDALFAGFVSYRFRNQAAHPIENEDYS